MVAPYNRKEAPMGLSKEDQEVYNMLSPGERQELDVDINQAEFHEKVFKIGFGVFVALILLSAIF
jgi:hypothetical protein